MNSWQFMRYIRIIDINEKRCNISHWNFYFRSYSEFSIEKNNIKRYNGYFTVLALIKSRMSASISRSFRYIRCWIVGCLLHVYLGAFSHKKTGPAHWDVLLRARAIDNQVYVAACSPAGDQSHHYHAWGHSAVVDPW